jgi:hypothetical protein
MLKFSKKTLLFTKKTLLVFFVFFVFLFSSTPKAKATIWPGVDPIIKTGLDQIRDMLNNLIVGVMKQAAVTMLNTQVNSLVSRSTDGQSAFITNWEDYLIDRPENRTDLYMNDYISEMTQGKGTYSNYSTGGNAGSANHSADLKSLAQNNLENQKKTPQITYEGDPENMFSSGSFKDMEMYLSGVNNPWAFDMAVQNEQQKELEKQTLLSQTRSLAYQGFIGTSGGSTHTVSYPGSLTKDAVANTENIPNMVLGNAQDIPEVIISAVISQMITRAIQQGFSGVQKNIQKNIRDVENKQNSNLNRRIKDLGPGARF